jgi:hypothetical protein
MVSYSRVAFKTGREHRDLTFRRFAETALWSQQPLTVNALVHPELGASLEAVFVPKM